MQYFYLFKSNDMKKIFTILIVLIVSLNVKAQIWSENFNNGLPANWILYNKDGKTPVSAYSYVTNAWVAQIKKDDKGNPIPNDSVIVSTSWYSPAGAADDWVVTHKFIVTDPNLYLRWDEHAFNAAYPDGYEVKLSYSDSLVDSFKTTLYSTAGAGADGYTTKGVSLASYNGQQIRVAFRNNSNDMELLGLDNIRVYIPPTNDLALIKATPVQGSPTDYAVTGANLILGGTVMNYGTAAVTSFTVKYQQGAGPIVSDMITGVNIPLFGKYTFSLTNVPLTMPSTLGDYPIKIWVELTGDADPMNDTANTAVTAVSFMPKKRILVEEGTGTWCGFCPRGAVYMDSLWHNYADKFSLVAVHNGDPMTVTAYDNFIGGFIGGYPEVVVDRRDAVDPAALINVYNEQKDYFGFADITLESPGADSFNITVKAHVKPAIDLNGDYRLALVLTEDDVHGKGSNWRQSNYYSNSQHLYGGGFADWFYLPSYVPDSLMYYHYVARGIWPSPDGDASSLPSTMTAGTTYDYTFNLVNVQPGYKRSNMRGVVMLIRNSDGHVLNSNYTTITAGIKNPDAAISGYAVYPNPANDLVYIEVNMNNTSSADIRIVDAMGRVVLSGKHELTAGKNRIALSLNDLPVGIYLVKLSTDKGSVTERLSVVR
jgi:hypothetical protein